MKRKIKQRVPVTPQNGDLSAQKFKKNVSYLNENYLMQNLLQCGHVQCGQHQFLAECVFLCHINSLLLHLTSSA